MEKAVIQYNEARARLMMDIIPPVSVRSQHDALPVTSHTQPRAYATMLLSGFVVILLMLTAFSAARASTTISYFSDSELSALNSMSAGILNFLVGEGAGAAFIVTEGDVDGEAVMPTVTLDAGSFNLSYNVTSAQTGGSSTFCNALQVDSTNGVFTYDGPLIGLNTGSTNTIGAWQFNVILPAASGVTDGETCVVDLIYSGWIDGGPSGSGYLDEETYTLTMTASVPAPLNAPLLIQSAVIEDPQALSVEGDVPPEEGEKGNRKGEHGAQGEQAENNHENNGRGEERSDERGTERERTAEPPAEVIVETVDVPAAAETPAVTETLPVPEGEPGV